MFGDKKLSEGLLGESMTTYMSSLAFLIMSNFLHLQ